MESNTEFKWNDKLVMEFCNYHRHPMSHLIEPEHVEDFKASKKPKKEWEIVSRITDATWWDTESGKQVEVPIRSVRRLSDGEVFMIGSKTTKGIITSFEVSDGILSVNVGEQNTLLRTIDLLKPLFTTEDGVKIFEGDLFFGVPIADISYPKWGIILFDNGATKYCKPNVDEIKTFSTHFAAEEYVLNNKPQFSLNDIESAYPNTIDSMLYRTFRANLFNVKNINQ